MKLGIKLWSKNMELMPSAQDLYDRKYYDYIELYVYPQDEPQYLKRWKELNIPIHLHAPHSYSGFNPALKEKRLDNEQGLRLVEKYREALKPEFIIFHPGMIGPIEETIHQYQDYKKRFPEIFKIACIENKPKVAQREEICLGASAEEIALLIKTLGFRFCFDFAHAICYAAWAKKPWQEVIKDFMKLNPYMFHICDGHISSVKDCHFHFSDGDYDMKTIVSLIPPGSLVSLETPKDFKNSLEDFIKDVEYIRSLEKEVIHQK